MSNGNYFTEDDNYQNLMKMLGMAQQVGAVVQKGRKTRSDSLAIRIDSITGTRPDEIPLYKRYTNPIDNFRIEEMIIELKNKVGTDINRTNLQTQEYYKDRIRAMELQIKDNTRFAIDKKKINSLQQELIDEVDSYMLTQKGVGGEELPGEKAKTIENLEKILVDYANQKESIIGYFSDRVAKDTELHSDIMSAEDYAQFIISELEYPSGGGKSRLSKRKADVFRRGLKEGNMAARQEDLNKINQANASVEAQWRGKINNLFKNYNEAKTYHDHLYGATPERTNDKRNLFISNETGISESDEEAGKAFDEKKDDAFLDYESIRLEILKDGETYQDMFDLDLAGMLFERGQPDDPLQKTVPQSIIDIETDIMPKVGEGVFGDLVVNDTKRIKALYDNIMHKKKRLTDAGENFREDKNFMYKMELFLDLYEEFDSEIKDSEDAKKAGFNSIEDVYSKKEIDIALIKNIIKSK